MYPGQVTRIVSPLGANSTSRTNTAVADAYFPFDPSRMDYGYVWHCHIVDHEDNEMMRPDMVPRIQMPCERYIQGDGLLR